MHDAEAEASDSDVQGPKSTLLDAATSKEGKRAIGGVMMEIRAEKGCRIECGFIVLCDGWNREAVRREKREERGRR
jgi:hypothetical protein